MFKFIAIALLCIVSVKADSVVVTATAGAATVVSTNHITVSDITVTASTTNVTTVRFFDSQSLTTYVQAAYTSFASYATNFSQIFTNESGVLITNTFTGVATLPTAVSVATNTIPTLYTIIVPASAQRTKIVRIQTMRGLVAVASSEAIIEVDYIR